MGRDSLIRVRLSSEVIKSQTYLKYTGHDEALSESLITGFANP